MSLSRRKVLSLVGGGVVAAAIPSAAFLSTRTPTKALAPWDQAGTYVDPRMNALSYALLAPNPHNRQPWEAELIGDDGVTIWRDPARDLPVTDPFARQLTIGMGCFLELMQMAAAQQGYAVQTDLFPEGEDGPVAQCMFTEGGAPDPLFAHVMDRRSHKEAFLDTPITKAVAAPLRAHADIYVGGEDRDMLKRIAHDAWYKEIETQDAWQESIDLLRIGKAEINAQPDGIDIGGPMMESLALVGLLTHDAAGDRDNPGTRSAIEETANAIMGAPAMTVSLTAGNSRKDQIAAGRDWLRLNLATTQAGLALRPVSQALQEYPEMKPLYDEIHSRFAPNGETVQMLGLLGYGQRTPRTPRWPLPDRMRNA
ncbi:Acg family FMN-binding oxidoreductase [Yoonia sp. 2307UL14-13]|uniref:Acg family FMN-binding oxidoreductase n=1 Tax=Yoonia sp. 2307UL14-13 TaxID=3126506 RepID=UPI0030AE5210